MPYIFTVLDGKIQFKNSGMVFRGRTIWLPCQSRVEPCDFFNSSAAAAPSSVVHPHPTPAFHAIALVTWPTVSMKSCATVYCAVVFTLVLDKQTRDTRQLVLR
mmetsp:Transcript_34403/g.82250  ORF Transcript_34403/g.82250 Transcript_34403/m.82250 type:complete len:103 (-) Transcript_34403:1246-1554(-)